ncbi:MAG: hypothetical protein ILP19_01980, partial [Oscillospiraceae bacterium]|nr:hypothetical protein [Oscillospiraceae bacterium]
DLSALTTIEGLESVYVSGAEELYDLPDLHKCSNLKEVVLYGTNIEDYSALLSAPTLETVSIQGQISDELRSELEKKGVTIEKIN